MVISCPCGGTSQAMTPHEGPVMVDIPGDADEVRLEDCLRFWGSGKEHIEGWDCPRCGVKGGTKQMNLEKGPDELIIAVSRFDGG